MTSTDAIREAVERLNATDRLYPMSARSLEVGDVVWIGMHGAPVESVRRVDSSTVVLTVEGVKAHYPADFILNVVMA